MLLPLLVDLPEGNPLAERSRNLLTLILICLLEVYRKGHHLASVRDRNSYVLIDSALLLINVLDDRICSRKHCVHTALICRKHVLLDLLGHDSLVCLCEELLIKAEVNRERRHNILRE